MAFIVIGGRGRQAIFIGLSDSMEDGQSCSLCGLWV